MSLCDWKNHCFGFSWFSIRLQELLVQWDRIPLAPVLRYSCPLGFHLKLYPRHLILLSAWHWLKWIQVSPPPNTCHFLDSCSTFWSIFVLEYLANSKMDMNCLDAYFATLSTPCFYLCLLICYYWTNREICAGGPCMTSYVQTLTTSG